MKCPCHNEELEFAWKADHINVLRCKISGAIASDFVWAYSIQRGSQKMPEDIDYYALISELKYKFEEKYHTEPTHLIVGLKEYMDIDLSPSLFERLKYVKDTTQGVLGKFIAGMKVLKCTNFRGIRPALLF